MIANHIHDALAQVERMQELILARRQFLGYSGTARMIGGVIALGVTLILARTEFLQTLPLQLAGWSVVLVAALLLNYGGLALWFFRRQGRARSLAALRPALEVIPALSLGAILSLALVLREQYDLLFGIWMGLYGLAHMGYRQSLPKGIMWVGLFYLAAGMACLLTPNLSFMNPWPMGLVFFAGESVGGWILRSGSREIPEHDENADGESTTEENDYETT